MPASNIKKNTVYNAVKTCSSILFPLITFRYASEILQPENMGKVSFSTTFIGYFSLIATLGITTHAVRECAIVRNCRKKLENTASQIFSINILSTLFAYVLLFITLLIPQIKPYAGLILIYGITVLLTTLGADWLNSAMEDFGYITVRTVLFQLLALALVFLLVKEQGDYYKYMAISSFSICGANLLNVFYRRRYCRVRFTLQIEWKKHLSPILLLFAMLLSQQILTNTDVVMLGLMKGNYETGIYSAALKITRIVSQMVYSILWVLLPRLTSYYEEERVEERNQLLRKALCFMIGLGLPCITGIIMTSKDIIRIAAGESYLLASPVLIILMGEFFFDLIGGAFIGNLIMLPSKKEKLFLIACILSAVVNVVMNYLLIPTYGIYAAAAATVVSRVVSCIYLHCMKDNSVNISNLKGVFAAPVTGCAGIVAVALVIKWFHFYYLPEFIVTALISALLYITVLLLMKYELAVSIVSSIKR